MTNINSKQEINDVLEREKKTNSSYKNNQLSEKKKKFTLANLEIFLRRQSGRVMNSETIVMTKIRLLSNDVSATIKFLNRLFKLNIFSLKTKKLAIKKPNCYFCHRISNYNVITHQSLKIAQN